MLIPVDITKIKPCALDGNCSEIGRSSANVEELREQLIQGNHICVLVSGYRGSGKTTFINQFQKMNDNDKHKLIYANLNLVKEEPYAILLRKLIRSLYAGLNDEMLDDIRKKNHKLAGKIKDAYMRTFFDISETSAVVQKIQDKESIQFSLKVKINGYLLIAVLFFILSFLPFIWPLQAVYTVSLWILSFVSFYTVWKLEKEITNVTSSSDEVLVNRIYDEEIAEKDLKEILKGLNESEYKVIFILDELDKIEQEEELEHIISTMKSLMLSDLACFILIAGQNLFYKLVNSKTMDDPVINSIFSKHVHIKSWRVDDFIHLFKKICSYKEEEEEVALNYCRSMILNSYKITRSFLNTIAQKVIYAQEAFYLEIDDHKINAYETDAVLLNLIEDIMKESIEGLYEDGIQDYLSYQLFVWVRKMKYCKGRFSIDEIKDNSRNHNSYPAWCDPILASLCSELIDRMDAEQLLEKNDSTVKQYKYLEKVEMDQPKDEVQLKKEHFMSQMVESVEIILNLAYDLDMIPALKENIMEYTTSEIQEIYKKLPENIKRCSSDFQEKLNLLETLSDEKHNMSETQMKQLRINKWGMLESLFVEYIQYVVSEMAEIHGTFSIMSKPFDILIKNEDKDEPNVYVEVKFRRNVVRATEIEQLIEALLRENEKNGKKNKLLLAIFSDKPKIGTKRRVNTVIDKLRIKGVTSEDVAVYESVHNRMFHREELEQQIRTLLHA